MGATFLYTNIEAKIYIKWPEGIVYLGIITKEFLEEYCILLGKLMYENVDAALLWIRILAKYLVNKYNLKRSKLDSCTFFRKYGKGNLELAMSVHLDDVFIAYNTETLKNIKKD